MRVRRIAGFAGMSSLAVLCALSPGSRAATAAAPAPSGLARASSISVHLSPQALVPIPSQVVSALKSLPDACGAVSLLQSAVASTTTVSLDSASTSGTLTSNATDMAAGRATSQAVGISLSGLDQVLANIESVLNGDLSCVTSNLASTALLPAALQAQIGSLEQQLSTVTAPLRTILGQLQPGVALNRALQVSLDQQPQSDDALALSGPLALSGNLAPFDAVAVSQTGATKWNVSSGPQVEAHNTTTNLSIGQSMPLTAASGSSSLAGVEASLNQELTSVDAALSALSQNQSVSAVCANPTVAQLPVCAALQGQATGQTTQALEAALTSVQSTVQGLLAQLSPLQSLLAALPSVDLSGVINTAGVTSSALTRPDHGGVRSLATSSFADLKLLQLVSAQIASSLGVPAGTPLIELKGLSSSTEAFVNGSDATSPAGTASVAEVDVLGQCVVGSNSGCPLSIPGTNITKTVSTPAGSVTAVIAWGTAQTVNNTPARKTANASALHVQLINGDGQGNDQIAPLGSPQNTSIAAVDVAATEVDDSMTPITASLVSAPPPETGMLGSIGFVGAGILGLAAIALRVVAGRPRSRGRR